VVTLEILFLQQKDFQFALSAADFESST